ncbi:MAG: DUF2267 domain-containing protein [Bradymonadaceae bacterium]
MNDEQFRLAIQRHAGDGEDIARRSAEATLEVFGELLSAPDRRVLADALPESFGEYVGRGEPDQSYDLDEFYRRVDVEHDQSLGFQVEHAQAVLAAIAELLDRETRQRVRSRLPEAFRPLLDPREIPEFDGSVHHDSRSEERKLSSARPGSRHPISEAESDAHSESVVRSDNPHDDRKLSSSTSSPNEGHDLASGEPDPEPEG